MSCWTPDTRLRGGQVPKPHLPLQHTWELRPCHPLPSLDLASIHLPESESGHCQGRKELADVAGIIVPS